jgi:class 3 adenylate cyclase
MRQIADWLREIGLEQYAQRFAENDIDFSILNELTDQDLEKIGIISLGHRRKLLRAIAALENPQNDKPSLATSSPDTRSADAAERRQVTVMFSDLVETVGRFGGYVAKYMGDGVLIYFGYPQAHEDDAGNLVITN